MNQETYVSFTEIVAELKQVCAEKRTGIMYITSGENRSAQLMLDRGEIVYLYFFNKRGRDALRLMSEIETGRFRFQDGSTPSLRTDLPGTEDILNYLSISIEALAGEPGVSKQVKFPGVTVAASDEGSDTLTVTQKRILEESLASYIGPMAAIICEDHLETVGTIDKAIALLAAEIPSSAQAQTFREEMMRKVTK
jgi:hypothetical protein